MTIIPYKPYSERTPDKQYQDVLRFIKTSPETYLAKNRYQTIGRWTNPETPKMVFKFENGFPICTSRKIAFWKKPITEILLFINGVHTLEEMVDAGCDWWEQWVNREHSAKTGLPIFELGEGSYGPILHGLPYYGWQSPETPNPDTDPIPDSLCPRKFNQVEHLVQSLKDGPDLNGHVISTWFPPLDMQHSKLKRQVAVAPCHGTIIDCTVINKEKLILTMVQRSADTPVGVVSNIIQYAALTIMLAHVCGYEPYKFICDLLDAQIYENQMEKVEEFLERKPFPFPTLQLTEEGQKITNIFDFKADHFVLSDYESHPAMEFAVTK
jgi:thymidylate synthase